MRRARKFEPYKLREWKQAKGLNYAGRLLTVARPGRGFQGRDRGLVADPIIDQWVRGMPAAPIRHIISLLGRKDDGYSEFDYYPFKRRRKEDRWRRRGCRKSKWRSRLPPPGCPGGGGCFGKFYSWQGIS